MKKRDIGGLELLKKKNAFIHDISCVILEFDFLMENSEIINAEGASNL